MKNDLQIGEMAKFGSPMIYVKIIAMNRLTNIARIEYSGVEYCVCLNHLSPIIIEEYVLWKLEN